MGGTLEEYKVRAEMVEMQVQWLSRELAKVRVEVAHCVITDGQEATETEWNEPEKRTCLAAYPRLCSRGNPSNQTISQFDILQNTTKTSSWRSPSPPRNVATKLP